MKTKLMYVELKSGYSDNGPAWIGKAFFSKSGQTVYFNGQAYKKCSGISGNYYEVESGEEYWISGVKKRGTNRHWAGSGKIQIDRNVLSEYLTLTELKELPKNKYEIVELNNILPKRAMNELENAKSEGDGLDDRLRFKNVVDLSNNELEALKSYYDELNLPKMYKKGRRSFKEHTNEIEFEIQKRKNTPNPAIELKE